MADMTFSLGGTTVPRPTTFVRKDDGNYKARRTLQGVLYVDFRERLRSWTIGWNLILVDSDFSTLKTMWEQQFITRTFPQLVFPEYGVDTPVFMEISDQPIRYNGVLIESFTMTLTEQYPVEPIS